MERKPVSLQTVTAVPWEHGHRGVSAPVSALQSDGFRGGQTLRVPKRPLPCRKGNDLIKLHSLLFHKQNHKCHFHGITLEQSASLNGNIATYTTVSYNSNPNNLLVNSRVLVQSQ